MSIEHWKIRIQGYGTFDFEGTEEDAEATRVNKARWECGNGIKWRADLSTEYDRLTAEVAQRLDDGKGITHDLWTLWYASKGVAV